MTLRRMLEERANQRLAGRQLRRPLLDSPLQCLVDLPQFFLSSFRVSDVVRHADEAHVFACRPPPGLGLGSHPPPLPVAAKEASLDDDNPYRRSDDRLFRKDSREIVRVKRSSPIEGEGFGIG